MTALRALPPLGWTAVVAWLSTPAWGGEETELFLAPLLAWLAPGTSPDQLAASHWLLRKAAHVAEYAVLAALWYWGLRPRGTGVVPWGALAITGGTAALDELHQASTAVRGGSAVDVALDLAAAAGTLAALHLGWSTCADRLTAALLWIAALGGTLLLGISVWLAVPSAWLWWSTPLAWIALGARRVLGRRA